MAPFFRLKKKKLAYYFNTTYRLKQFLVVVVVGLTCVWCQRKTGSPFSTHYLGSGDWTEVIRFGGKHLPPLSHLVALHRTKWTLDTCRTERKKKDQCQKVPYSDKTTMPASQAGIKFTIHIASLPSTSITSLCQPTLRKLHIHCSENLELLRAVFLGCGVCYAYKHTCL